MYPHHQGTTSPIQHVYPHPSDPRLRGLGYGPVNARSKEKPLQLGFQVAVVGEWKGTQQTTETQCVGVLSQPYNVLPRTT